MLTVKRTGNICKIRILSGRVHTAGIESVWILGEKRVKGKNMKKRQNRFRFGCMGIFLLAWLLVAGCKTDTGGKEQSAEQETKITAEESGQNKGTEPEEQPKTTELAAFLPDYTSAPLLNTTEIKCLSMEVGAKENEVQLNWFSPSGKAGKTEWKDSSGKISSFEAECTASVTVEGYYVNKAVVTGLKRGEIYTYRTGNEEAWSPEYTYRVPEDTGELTFVVTSDAQIGQSEMEFPEDTADRWNRVLTRLAGYVPESSFLLHMGDQVADYGSQEQYELFLEHLPLYRTALAPAVGNHDVANEWSMEANGHPDGPYFYEHFFVPNRSDMCESPNDLNGNYFFIRDDVLFIVLNACTGHPGEFQEAYAAQIISEHPEVKWRIVIQHYAAYSGTGNSGNGKSKEYLAHIAMDNGVDLVLTGHDHAYSRSAFINREGETLEGYAYESGSVAVNPEGVMHVTCGTSSGCMYHYIEEEEHLVFQGQPETPVAMRIDVTDSELHLRTYLVEDWTLYDEYTIRKE